MHTMWNPHVQPQLVCQRIGDPPLQKVQSPKSHGSGGGERARSSQQLFEGKKTQLVESSYAAVCTTKIPPLTKFANTVYNSAALLVGKDPPDSEGLQSLFLSLLKGTKD